MRVGVACLVLLACASGKRAAPAPAPAATITAGQLPSDAPPKPAPAAPSAAPVPAPEAPVARGPMTAAEAAREAAQQPQGGAGDAAATAPAAEDSPCQSDGDCALTHVEAGACCPMLCAPRVVTTLRAQELKAKSASCGRPCPLPQCMPPRQHIVPSCVQNRCVAKSIAVED
jgi:hypothetical protein